MATPAAKQFLDKLFAAERARLATLAPVAAKKASWKDDAAAWVSDARKDPAVAASMDAAQAARDAEKALQQQLARERQEACARWHVWRKANPYVWQTVVVKAAVAEVGERGWAEEAQYAKKQVRNREVCPYCAHE